MEIKVGSKWEGKNTPTKSQIIEILYIGEKGVYYKYVNGNQIETSMDFEYFEKHYTPHIEFEWYEITSMSISCENQNYGILQYEKNAKNTTAQYELLYNYNRYRELVDTVEFNEECNVWCINGDLKIDWLEYESRALMELTFSTEQHAKTFLQLAKDNGCL